MGVENEKAAGQKRLFRVVTTMTWDFTDTQDVVVEAENETEAKELADNWQQTVEECGPWWRDGEPDTVNTAVNEVRIEEVDDEILVYDEDFEWGLEMVDKEDYKRPTP